jgi:hypothetical protein
MVAQTRGLQKCPVMPPASRELASQPAGIEAMIAGPKAGLHIEPKSIDL